MIEIILDFLNSLEWIERKYSSIFWLFISFLGLTWNGVFDLHIQPKDSPVHLFMNGGHSQPSEPKLEPIKLNFHGVVVVKGQPPKPPKVEEPVSQTPVGQNIRTEQTPVGQNIRTEKKGNPNPGGSPSNDSLQLDNNLVCPIRPNPDEVIASPEFWNSFTKNKKKNCEFCELENGKFWEDGDCERLEDEDLKRELELQTASTGRLRRKLLAVPSMQRLDGPVIKQFDYTTFQRPPYNYIDKDGRVLVLPNKELKKMTYCHQSDLGVYHLADRIQCPTQPLTPAPVPGQPEARTKYQRQDCWAMTDKSVEGVAQRIIELTTTSDSNHVVIRRPMEYYPSQSSLYYVDRNTLECVIFHDLQNGKPHKLWSVKKYGNEAELGNDLSNSNYDINPTN